MLETVLVSALSAILGGGFASWFFRRWLDRRLCAAEDKKKFDLEMRRKERELHEEFHHRTGRLLFWLVRWTARWEEKYDERLCNGDLDRAWHNFDDVESRMKAHGRVWTSHNIEK